MAILPRAALLLALAVFLAPAVYAEEAVHAEESAGEGAEPSGDGSDPVEEIEECVCNGTQGNGTQGANETEEPDCAVPDCVPDPDARASCLDLGEVVIDPWDGPASLQVDTSCYEEMVKNAVKDQPAVVRNLVCTVFSLLSRTS